MDTLAEKETQFHSSCGLDAFEHFEFQEKSSKHLNICNL